MLTKNEIILIIVILILLLLIIIYKNDILNTFQNNTSSNNTTSTTTSELNENGFIKSNIVPSYWYNYQPSEIRSKCFDCDAEKKYKHPSNCIDCETKGGHKIDKLFNRVMTR